MPYTSPPGFHRHQCPDCGAIWEHSDECAELRWPANVKAHLCPGCKTESFRAYAGEFAPDYTTNQEATHVLDQRR